MLSVVCVSWAILMVLWLAHLVAWRVAAWVQDQRMTPAAPFARVSVGPLESDDSLKYSAPTARGHAR